ncbi:uncharacterized protein EURHEDRAFT_381663 [Aspergillus ruber CBS 135680]|uniref:Uncharacterized protein n=1 Tax=Aspergillus ruber (strain CBS 135680) TaxID=1388766 RepID=A0A017S1G7_ASPRC|nr:uncharacterized protein EURHEDRAFT_381663 [Aspergillus ruber CBS 135680]EYE90792.1 hypothetical protein EURHEDRAFT_381663 [Aspergillus ruber CBS 135680]
MKFTIAAAATLFTAFTAALPEAFTLVADGGKTVLTDGQKLLIGADPASHEILILRGSNETTGVSFTSKDQTPTGFQTLYVVDGQVAPVALTLPHSGATPEGASLDGFGTDKDGYFTHDGKNYFGIEGYGDNPERTINWVDGHSSTQRVVNLWVKECKGC